MISISILIEKCANVLISKYVRSPVDSCFSSKASHSINRYLLRRELQLGILIEFTWNSLKCKQFHFTSRENDEFFSSCVHSRKEDWCVNNWIFSLKEIRNENCLKCFPIATLHKMSLMGSHHHKLPLREERQNPRNDKNFHTSETPLVRFHLRMFQSSFSGSFNDDANVRLLVLSSWFLFLSRISRSAEVW